MDVLVDSREVLRNDALILLIQVRPVRPKQFYPEYSRCVLNYVFQLTKGNANLQKIVAFENAFDKIVDIIELEGYSDGGIVVEDCLRLMLNLLRNNSSNQTFFRQDERITLGHINTRMANHVKDWLISWPILPGRAVTSNESARFST